MPNIVFPYVSSPGQSLSRSEKIHHYGVIEMFSQLRERNTAGWLTSSLAAVCERLPVSKIVFSTFKECRSMLSTAAASYLTVSLIVQIIALGVGIQMLKCALSINDLTDQ
jgi:hypothetical protein